MRMKGLRMRKKRKREDGVKWRRIEKKLKEEENERKRKK